MDTIRELLYPLGFLSSIAFTLRFLIQWISSEKQQRSFVMPSFWKISLVGNTLLFFHSFIQIQFHVCIVQVCNGVIAWRNLNLMAPQDKQYKLITVTTILGAAMAATTGLFFLQSFYLPPTAADWFRTPITPWTSDNDVSLLWHLAGFLGIILFNSRFWIQWWSSEIHRKSYLGPGFWWISLFGAVLSLLYFFRIGDVVNWIGPAFGIIPSIRNLMLIRKTHKSHTEVTS